MKTLPPSKLAGADFVRRTYHVVVPNDTMLEDIVKPIFWSQHAIELRTRAGALIDVVREDYSLDVQLRIVRVDKDLVFVRPLRVHEDNSNLTTADGTDTREAPEGYKVDQTPKGYYAKRLSTSTVIAEALPSRAAAIDAAVKHKSASGD